MPRLTPAQREINRRVRLEQTKLLLESKIAVLQAALDKTEAELNQPFSIPS